MDDAISFIAGVACGFVSGLLPGLHPNTAIAVLSSLVPDQRALAVMIISLYPSSLVSSFIPSIFFGVPDRATVVAVLPGQRMLLDGEGITALKVVLISCLLAALLSVALFVPSLGFFPAAYALARPHMKYVLLALSVVLVARSKLPAAACAVFIAAGMLGTFALHTGVYDPFLPLFSGLFAMAAIAAYRKTPVPPQADKPVGFGFVPFVVVGVVLGMLADLVPGIGSPAQVAAFATIAMPVSTTGYLATLSSISVSQALFSLSTSASIDKSRVGATAWLSQAMEIGDNLPLLLALFLLSIALSSLAVYALRRKLAALASLDFSRANFVLAAYLAAITLVLDGGTGMLVLAISTALGWLTIRMGVERTVLMGAIIVPTLLLLWGVYV